MPHQNLPIRIADSHSFVQRLHIAAEIGRRSSDIDAHRKSRANRRSRRRLSRLVPFQYTPIRGSEVSRKQVADKRRESIVSAESELQGRSRIEHESFSSRSK
jgi:hypothetical protein